MTTTPERTAAPSSVAPAGVGAPRRARLDVRHLRKDAWWVPSAITVGVLLLFIAYSTWRAFEGENYYADPYLSPFYSPCLATNCEGSTFPEVIPGSALISPALYILVIPLGFRMTCYYYRKAYYRAFWQSPPACAVAEPHGRYTGETRFPLVFQNLHRYFFYAGLVYNVILTYDVAHTLWSRDDGGVVGLGTLVLLTNATLLWLYSLSCHSCRHVMGGRLVHFSKHPVRYRLWTWASALNARHMKLAWVSLIGVALTDLYVRLLATGAFTDPVLF